MFSLLKDHAYVLILMLDRCQQLQISLNLKKCVLCMLVGFLLGHVACKDGILVDPTNITFIVNSPSHALVK